MRISTLLVFSIVLSSPVAFADAISSTKPQPSDSEAAAKCARLSAVNRARGNRTLVIAFEGLASYSGSATQAAYQAHALALRGQKDTQSAGFGMGGFVARGLMIPVIASSASKFDFLVFPYTATGTAHTCALEWMKVPGRRLILAGHSFGGMSLVRVTEELAKRNVKVTEVISIDPRSWTGMGIYRARGTDRWENYFQFGGGLPGKSIPAADVNLRLSGGHTGMPFQPAVRHALLRALAH